MKKNSGMHEKWKVWREGLTVVGIRPEALVLEHKILKLVSNYKII